MNTVSADIYSPEADERVRRFRKRAVPAILGIVVIFSLAALWSRVNLVDDYAQQQAVILGMTHYDVYSYFGEPVRDEPDGRGGIILYYEDFQVGGDQFVQGYYRIFVGPNGRVYRFQRD